MNVPAIPLAVPTGTTTTTGDAPTDGFAALLTGELDGAAAADQRAVVASATRIEDLVAAMAIALGLRSGPEPAAADPGEVSGTQDAQASAGSRSAVTDVSTGDHAEATTIPLADTTTTQVAVPVDDVGDVATSTAATAATAAVVTPSTADGAEVTDVPADHGADASRSQRPAPAPADVPGGPAGQDDGELPARPVADPARAATSRPEPPADARSTEASRPADAPRTDPVGPSTAASAPSIPLDATAPPAPTRLGEVSTSAAVARVLDAIEALEHAPPPRVMVIESGEARLRIGIEAGLVRVTLLGDRTDVAEQVLRETAAALESRGLEADVDGRSRGRHDTPGDDRAPADGPRGERTAPVRSRTRAGLQL